MEWLTTQLARFPIIRSCAYCQSTEHASTEHTTVFGTRLDSYTQEELNHG